MQDKRKIVKELDQRWSGGEIPVEPLWIRLAAKWLARRVAPPSPSFAAGESSDSPRPAQAGHSAR